MTATHAHSDTYKQHDVYVCMYVCMIMINMYDKNINMCFER